MVHFNFQFPLVCLRDNITTEVNGQKTNEEGNDDNRSHKPVHTYAAGFYGSDLIKVSHFTGGKKTCKEDSNGSNKPNDFRNEVEVIFDYSKEINILVNKVIEVFHHIDDNKNESKGSQTKDYCLNELFDEVSVKNCH